MEVSIIDLSKYLSVSPDTVDRWIRQGKLPVSRKGRVYRFKSKELEKWAQANNIRLNITTDSDTPKSIHTEVTLVQAVNNGGVYFDIKGDDVESVLTNMVATIDNIPDNRQESLLLQLIERENALSTGIGNGFAIPHPRQQQDYLDDPMVFICFLSEPVNYNALDHKDVSVLFLILCPELKMHLQLLSAISLCLKDPGFVSLLKSNPQEADLIAQINRIHNNQP